MCVTQLLGSVVSSSSLSSESIVLAVATTVFIESVPIGVSAVFYLLTGETVSCLEANRKGACVRNAL